MRNLKNQLLIIAVALILSLVLSLPAAAGDKPSPPQLQTYLQSTAAWLVRTVPQPAYGSVGGEWTVMAMARADGEAASDWYAAYYTNLQATVQAAEGVLSTRKYTEYSRVILALTALGHDPADVGGYNLLSMLGDYDKVLAQGINGPIFALLALDSGDYAIPVCAQAVTQASREMYIDAILNRQNTDGGWSLAGSVSEPDVTGMALQALAGYRHHPGVELAIERGVMCLSGLQDQTGNFTSGGAANVESTVQVIMALCQLQIDPRSSQFTKNGHSALDSLLGYYVAGGGFKHDATATGPDIMGTEQGFYALAAYQRFLNQQNSFYDMADVKASPQGGAPQNEAGLAGKNADIRAVKVTQANRSFDDIQGLATQPAIEALAAREIINGLGDNLFAPNRNMTRAEFAAIVVRALGLTPVGEKVFSDVAETSWYSAYVATACKYGIVSGTSAVTFTPEATITRQEAAVMTARAARLAGLDSALTITEIQAELDRFADSAACSAWSREPLAFCYRQAILVSNDGEIQPTIAVTRAEIAEMLYRLLTRTKLI